MPERTEGSIEIGAPPRKVMAVLADFDSYPSWAGLRRAEVRRRDSRGRGAEVYMEVAQMGIEARYTLAYRYAARDGGMSWTTKEASGAVRDVVGEYLLEPTDEGATRVTYRITLEPAITLPGFLRRQAERQIVNTALGGLKKEVERRG